MFLPCFPCCVRPILLLNTLLGLGLPIISTQVFHLSYLNQLFVPGDITQENFDPPSDPAPVGTRGAGSRGIVSQPTFPQT